MFILSKLYINVLFDSLFLYICPEKKSHYSMSKKQKFQLLALFVIILISFLFIRSHNYNKESNVESNKKSSPVLTCSNAVLVDVVPLIDFSGRINSASKINIVSEVNGISKITQSTFEVGEEFKKGEVLIYIKDEDVDLELKSIKSQFLSLLVQVLPDLKMDFPSLGSQFQKYVNGFNLQGNISSLPQTTSSKQRNFLSARQIYANYYTIKALENKLNKFKIRAPFDGVITKALIDPGSNVIVGQPLGEFIDPKRYEISTSISVSESNIVNKGDSVIIKSDDLEGEVRATIKRIGNHINELTQSIDVFIEVESGIVKDGMYVTGQIICNTLKQVSQIERSSLINNNNIYTIKNDSLKLTKVDIIVFQNNHAVVRGLTEKDCLVKENRNYFYDGMSIK